MAARAASLRSTSVPARARPTIAAPVRRAVPALPATAADPAFILRAAPAAQETSSGSGSGLGDVHPFGPAALSAAGADLLETILLIAGGLLLIGLMCVDAAGVGPRHDYLRRRAGAWRLPWR